MLPSEILTRAADLIAPENAWAQGDLAFNQYGEFVYPDSTDACRWCAAGAIDASAEEGGALAAKRELIRFLGLPTVAKDDAYPERAIGIWNDNIHRTQPEVVSALRAAAELAKQQESA